MSIPLMEVQFDKEAQQVIPAQEDAIVRRLEAGGIDHLVVISHGWNNDMDEARTLYREFLRQLEGVAGAATAARMLAIGVLWPSKRFADAELIPGGAASAGGDPRAERALVERLQDLKSLFGDDDADDVLEQMKALVPGLQGDPNKQKRFVHLIGGLVDRHTDASQRTADEGSAKISDQDGADLLKRFSLPIIPKTSVAGMGGAAGGTMGAGIGGNPALAAAAGAAGAAGIGDFFSGVSAGAVRLLNLVTYQTMKDRAGLVGRNGVNPFLSRIQARASNVALHLVGHSFGGRLVTATVDGPHPLRVKSMLLLQAAYSHNGLARNFDGRGNNGFFHAVLTDRKVSGPILITHSTRDRAVGLAYPLASRLNGDNAAGIGDKNDQFGGMGANGAQHVGGTDLVLQPVGGAYNFDGSTVFNLNGDNTITGHSDVARAETAYVLAKAMGL
jgi:hypothetical protein